MAEKYKILIIDDEIDTYKTIFEIINNNFEICYAIEYSDATIILKEWRPDIILLDWVMPNTDGLSVLKLLKESNEYKEIPIIMVTGFMTSQNDLVKAFKEGVVDFIRKPFDSIELIARINSVCRLSYYYNELINSKEKELIYSALRITENIELMNEFISTIKSSLINKDEKLQPIIVEIESAINSKICDINMMQFDKQFSDIHNSFFVNLVKNYPNLSKAELRLCSLLRLGLSSKQISVITHTTVDSVRVSRNRLRTKLGIKREDNLTTFLINL